MEEQQMIPQQNGIPTQESEQAGKRKSRVGKEILEWILYILGAFLVASLIQSEVFALTQVNMSSMVDTLHEKDELIMNRLAYRFSDIERGDIVVFLKEEETDTFAKRMEIYLTDVQKKFQKTFRRNRLIKRVIGLPGDTIEIIDNVLYVNGEAQDEDYARIDPDTGIVENGYLTATEVPEGKIFVMGDNRGGSLDSRAFGFVDISWVEGQAVFRLAPFSDFGSL